MPPIMKKKYEAGEGAKYMTRAKAMRKLQLSLKDFRKLCILKGIYPREPNSRKKAQKGEGGIQTLYHKKDIQFLLHEPVIWKFREAKVLGKKIGRAKATGNYKEMRQLVRERPSIKLDHIVKERYPTFIDALRDLDDCLTLCFLFATFPSMQRLPREQSTLCRRLTLEFMHAVIASRALRKVFISIKGYYFQAEIKGVTITWILPHHFSFEPQTKEEVDFKIMSTFVQFYIVVLGFVNFRLYNELNLKYPPIFSTKTERDVSLVDEAAFQGERVAALNIPIAANKVATSPDEEPVEIDNFNLTGDVNEADEMKKEAERLEKLKNLFNGLKVFLSREVPREPLTFALKCFGAQVSWDKNFFIGATFDESDETITHQIVDRPSLSKQFISRYYVQPQWVFDCINAGELLPVEKYFIGCVLPPHLSPFKEKIHVQYVPPEASGSQNDDEGAPDKIDVVEEKVESDSDEAEASDKSNESEIERDEDDSESEPSGESEMDSDSEQKINQEQDKKKLLQSMKVKKGKVESADPDAKKKEDWQEWKLREKMVEKKHRALYKSMMQGRRLRNYDVKILKRKRKQIDDKKKKVPVAQN